MRQPHLAQKSVSSASAAMPRIGTKSTSFGLRKEQLSYFAIAIALEEKIISSGPEALTWSTDHVDNNKLAKGTPFLTRLAVIRFLGGYRRRAVHRPCRRGHLPARSVRSEERRVGKEC